MKTLEFHWHHFVLLKPSGIHSIFNLMAYVEVVQINIKIIKFVEKIRKEV